MTSRDDMAARLDQLISSHYYSEDFELLASLRAFRDGLEIRERNLLDEITLERLVREGSIVDIMLCAIARIPSAVPVLASRLARESEAGPTARALIAALRHYDSDEAWVAVERFLDSDMEMEALEALACIDFTRALPVLVRRMRQPHFHGPLLHMLHERRKKVGLDPLIVELNASSATRTPDFRERLGDVLGSKSGAYNPFPADEIERIMSAVGEG